MSALAQLRVVDLTDLRGALAGRILADLGADVIKVEPPGGDPERLRPPFVGDVAAADRSLPFLFRHANKRGAVLDLDTAAGRDRLRALCDGADVLIENLGPAEAERLDLAPAGVGERHPHLVHVTISDFGRSGPRARWRLEPLPALAASGALYASGLPDRPPCWLPGHLAHDCAAIVAVTGALAAILDRARHGHGQTVEVAVQEAALATLHPWPVQLPDYARVYPVLPEDYPRDGDGAALVLPTADGWVRVLAISPRQLRALLAVIIGEVEEIRVGGPHHPGLWDAIESRLEAAGLHLLAALARLPAHGVALPAMHGALELVRRFAAPRLRMRPRAEVLALARRLRLPMAPVNRPEEFVTAAQTRARGYFRQTRFPGLRDAPFAPFPCTLTATPVVLDRAAPAPGADDPPPVASPWPAAGEVPTAAAPILAGLRVVDLGVGIVVPSLCTVLHGLGAEVIKVESRRHPDFLRRLTVDPETPNHSWTFNDVNRGQRSICLDLDDARGRELALRLCAAADVVAENRQGGLVESWGLDYAQVRALRPDVIYVSSQGYGRGGPLGDAPAFGPLVAAFAGATYVWNHPDTPYPAGSALEHPDYLAGWVAAIAVLSALEHRRRTGEGQRIEMAQSEVAAFLLGELYLQAACTGRPAAREGNAAAHACPHGVFPCRGEDRWCAIAVVGDEAWERFRRCLGWPPDPRRATLEGRLAARAMLEDRVATWTRSHDAEELAATLQAASVSAMPVLGARELRADGHLAARGALITIDDPEIGPVRHVACPLRLSRTPLAASAPAPRLGADTRAVLQDILGLTPEAVARLIADEVCG